LPHPSGPGPRGQGLLEPEDPEPAAPHRATIPEPANQVQGRRGRGPKGGRPPTFDKEIYKKRNTVERTTNRLRGYRAVATRYDKREFMYRGTIDVATIGIWLR
jgi:transposase